MIAMETKLREAFAGLGNSIAYAIPKVGVGIILIILGLVFAKVVEIVLRTMLVRMRFDRLAEKSGVAKALRRIGLREQPNVFLPKLAYFLIIFLLLKTVSDALGLIAISNAIGAFFAYLPNIIGALLLLVLGTTVGQFAGRMVTQAAESSGIEFAAALGRLISALIIFIVAMMAISQLRIDTEMIRIVSSFVLGAGALAFGLAFGLGTREIVRSIVTGFYARKLLAIGESLEIAGESGTLIAITATHAILTREGKDIVLPNSTFIHQTSKQ
jgi:small-conductance mechanosensitive channel